MSGAIANAVVFQVGWWIAVLGAGWAYHWMGPSWSPAWSV
jgi:hypothetical protein